MLSTPLLAAYDINSTGAAESYTVDVGTFEQTITVYHECSINSFETVPPAGFILDTNGNLFQDGLEYEKIRFILDIDEIELS